MKLKQIFEAPFTDKQEDRFLTALRQDVKRHSSWPSPIKVKKMVKAVSPKAKKIGAGAFSQAFGRDRSNVVIKLTHDGDGEDTLRFLRWAKSKRNPHLPKIFSIKKIKSRDEGGVYDTNVYVRMEKLVPLYPRRFKWKPEHVPFLEWMYLNDYGEKPEYVTGDKIWKKIKQGKRIHTSRLTQLMRMLNRLNRGDELDIAIDSNAAHNIMVRPSTNEIVVHDPF